ncbi:MAG: phosphocholine cytidylyltransferase family protein [Dehalococcoidales bacterium]|nr:MAG: phosphocholine cytidylyltransferase family protein [Dehalococcoidales bacterium]
MKAIILAAGIGKRLRGATGEPKCLLKISGLTLLERYLSALEKAGILDVVIVVGYRQEMIVDFVGKLNFPGGIKFIENPDFQKGSILSLNRAVGELEGDVLLMDGDVYFETEILARLVNEERADLVAVDTTSKSTGEEMMVGINAGRILDIKRELAGNFDTSGEAVGFYRLGAKASTMLREILTEHVEAGEHNLGYEDILPFLFQSLHFRPLTIDGLRWVEIDFEEDIARAESIGDIGL